MWEVSSSCVPASFSERGARRRQAAIASTSALEEGPALLVAEPLIVKHKVADLGWKLRPLPPALCTTRAVAIVRVRRSASGPDGVRSRAKLVFRHMSHRNCVSGRSSRFRGGSGSFSGRAVRVKGRSARLSHGDRASHPRARLFDRPTRALVPWVRLLEVVQYVFRASRSPRRKKPMIGVLEGAAATHRDKPTVSASFDR